MLDVIHVSVCFFFINLNASLLGESLFCFFVFVVVVGIVVLKLCFIVKLSVLRFLVCFLLCPDVALLGRLSVNVSFGLNLLI